MSRPIQQAIANLIPRHSGALPSELVELAGSLLAQSRNKCSNLKSEEEVARIYACANLACERLKTSLNLPPIEPRPPIPPRVYSKLYSYFDRTLTSSAARQRAKNDNAKVRNNPSTTSSSGKALPQRLTPSKAKSFENFRSQRTAKRGLVFKGRQEKDDRVPRWLGPVVRLLCREMETRGAVPHVLAGVESVLCLPCPGGESEMKGRVPALVAAVWFLVVVRMRGPERQGMETMKRKNMVREVLAAARTDEGVMEKMGDEEGAWMGWEDTVAEKDVNSWRKEIVGKGWRELDWFTNIGEGVGVETDGDGDAGEDGDEGKDVQMGENQEGVEISGRRARPGTMIQEQYCVTIERREAYIEWRDNILEHIEKLMARGYMERDDAEIGAR
ncbi:uncharacterized protein RAG0_03314 [Rhynchosporium agropyri]|uniref:ORC6 first cyclin-like domain-containing protein n=1 Tax=Rhynchosporium agropyri TaxID=914238 RepID=A0A1E1K866_9HELO|nr:uncharacterized protein RAG0_03314 [Rhynchosporium agropyri]